MKSEYINCKNCKDDCRCRGKNITPICVSFTPVKTTNADRIRAMTDEKLAEWLWFKVGKCPPFDVCPSQCIPCEAKDCWLDWLKQETKYETTY